MIAALLFYIIYLIGVIVFVVNPALVGGSSLSALAYGALFGLVAYSTYDLTNLATLKGFKTKIVIIDLIWGSFLTATTSVVTYLVVNLWMKSFRIKAIFSLTLASLILSFSLLRLLSLALKPSFFLFSSNRESFLCKNFTSCSYFR